MNILLINHYAGSPAMGMEYRPHYLAREWVRAGHSVSIIAASHSHVRNRQPLVNRGIQGEQIDGIRYYWIRTPRYHRNDMGRVMNILAFLFRLRRYTGRIVRSLHPDVVIASSTYPFDNSVAHRIARRAGAQHIYEVHDLWPLSPIELGGYSPSHPFIRLVQRAEDRAYRQADAVVSLLPETLAYMKERGLDPSRWHHVPNGVVAQEWEDPPEIPEAVGSQLAGLRERFRLMVAYTGTIGLANALSSFVEAAGDPLVRDVAFIMVGRGPERESLEIMARQRSLRNVFFFDPLPKTMVPSLLAEFDLLYIGLQDQSLFRFGISPNKLFDYMMAGKPVIKAIHAPNDPVQEAGCGLSIAPEAPGELVEAILQLSALPEHERREMGARGREYVRRHHDYSVLAARFLAVIQQVRESRKT